MAGSPEAAEDPWMRKQESADGDGNVDVEKAKEPLGQNVIIIGAGERSEILKHENASV